MDRCGCTNSPSVGGGLKHFINTNYYYDGDRLITEVTTSHRNDYLYDENRKVYRFIQDSITKYYYAKYFRNCRHKL